MSTTMRRLPGTAALAASALALAACSGGGGFDDPAPGESPGGATDAPAGELAVLIGSSGDAETDAVTAAVEAWSAETGVTASVTVASDLPQQLSQGFAAGDPPDVFYVSTDHLAGWAANGSLHPYGDQLANVEDFHDSLRENFTVDDQLVCAPKDFSTLALVINTDAWAEAGLGDDDVPTTWDELADVAAALTTDSRVGLSFGPEYQRIGVFMAQAGGGLVAEDGTTAIVDSPENLAALEYVQQLMTDGVMAYPADVGAGWGGEAFGTGAAAMTIEGNWIVGALRNDFPDTRYRVVELPAGPAGKGTLQFTNCWGIAADSDSPDAALDLVEHLTSTEQQIEFASAFGVMPSVRSAAEAFAAEFPEQEAFITSAGFATGMPTAEGAAEVISDFNAQLEGLANADASEVLASVQANLQAALDAAG